jgi:precorrin-8X/cobalt-precorrin-8 methylmutase
MDAGDERGGYVYLRDPDDIYRRSFAMVREATDISSVPEELRTIALRLVHACAMPQIVVDLAASPSAAEAGRAAMQSGAPVLCDVEMVAHGVIRSRLPAGNDVICTLNDPAARDIGVAKSFTRAAAAVELWPPHLAGAVVAIGNAPTALFRLLELIDAGAPTPAVILGFPVGFVGAAESKDALIGHPGALPYIALKGRFGGSALAAAAVNALASEMPGALGQ